nr:unnamed protein product [Spirometra erinaceieuropaei]
MVEIPVGAVAAAEKNASVKNRRCQLRDTVQSTALAVRVRARCQHQGWFDDNDDTFKNLLAKQHRVHKAHVNRPIDNNKAAVAALCNSGCADCRTLGRPARPRRSKDMPRPTNGMIPSTRSKLSAVPHPKASLLFPAPTELPFSMRRRKFCSDGQSTLEASLTLVPRSLTPASSVCLK